MLQTFRDTTHLTTGTFIPLALLDLTLSGLFLTLLHTDNPPLYETGLPDTGNRFNGYYYSDTY